MPETLDAGRKPMQLRHMLRKRHTPRIRTIVDRDHPSHLDNGGASYFYHACWLLLVVNMHGGGGSSIVVNLVSLIGLLRHARDDHCLARSHSSLQLDDHWLLLLLLLHDWVSKHRLGMRVSFLIAYWDSLLGILRVRVILGWDHLADRVGSALFCRLIRIHFIQQYYILC